MATLSENVFTCFCYDVIMKGLLPKCKALLFFICCIAEVKPIFLLPFATQA